jgi:uncharacterized membrane protein YdjX (TVP38/TMEM64 family)
MVRADRRRILLALLLFLLAATAAVLVVSGGIEALFSAREALLREAKARPATALGMFFVAHALATLLLIPGALWLSVLAGFLFGPWIGAVVTLTASTLGNAGLFAAARSVMRPQLEARAGRHLAFLERHFRRSAFSFMLLLRFLPFMPYPVANLAPPLLGASMPAYLIATPIGLAPAVAAYALLGAGLAATDGDGGAPGLHALSAGLAPGLSILAVISLVGVLAQSAYSRRTP